MGYLLVLIVAAVLGAATVVSLGVPDPAVGWLIIWPMYTGVLYVFLGIGYIVGIEWWLKDKYPSMGIKGDDSVD